MNKYIHHILRKPYSLITGAVILYLFSFLLIPDYSKKTSLGRESGKLEHYITSNTRDFYSFAGDSQMISKLSNRKENLSELNEVLDNPFSVFIFKEIPFSGPELIFWNNHKIYPPDSSISGPDGEYFDRLANGYYVILKKTISRDTVNGNQVLIGLIPVQYNYYVETSYLPTRFVHNRKSSSRIKISERVTDFPVKGNSGHILFYISAKEQTYQGTLSGIALWLRVSAAFLLLWFIFFYTKEVCRKKGDLWGGLFLLSALIIFRILNYTTSFPVQFRQFELFNPGVYGSNPVQKSLGDLLINSIFFCWIMIFSWGKFSNWKFSTDHWSARRKWIWGTGVSVMLTLFTFMAAKIIRSLAADSNISFDVTNFFSLNSFSVVGFVVLGVIAIGYFYFARIAMAFLEKIFPHRFYLVLFIMAVSGLLFLTITPGKLLIGFYIAVLGWLLFYAGLIKYSEGRISRSGLGIAGPLFRIFFFSVSITGIIILANQEKEWELRKRMADKIAVQSDPFNERQLSISFTYIDRDFLQNNFDRFRNPETGKPLRDSILRESGYLYKYDSRIYIFDEKGKELHNEELQSLNTLNTILTVRAKRTNTPDLYYYETAYDKITFILKRTVQDPEGRFLGTFFIVSTPEQYSSDALYPELFKQANQYNPEESPVYSYAIYKNNILVTPFFKYSFPTSLAPGELPVQQFEKRKNGDFTELWHKASQNKVVVIVKKSDSLIEAITLFSYIFCVFLFLVTALNGLIFLIRMGGGSDKLRRLMQWNIRSQVHSTIIAISIISFIIIGIATISFFISRYEQNNREKLSRTMKIMVNEMENKLARRMIFDDQVPIYDSVANTDLQELVNEVAEIHNVDVNVYDTTGNLHVTSQPLIYREGFLSKKMNPAAFYYLNRKKYIQQVQQEKLASLSFLSIYSPVRDESGRVYTYLNIPYFLSQRELRQEISNFLVTIINLNAFIFLLAGVIALFITNRITRSFSLISEKMKEVNLARTNEEVIWNRDDEIGELVKEYNKMVNKLGESAAALARSEREGAWREMARQVAHEIKNPLTPMKLSIQYLQKSIDGKESNVKELTANVARTLVEQIDHLSKIASDFSQFANISNTHPVDHDLRLVIRSLKELYQANPHIELRISLPDEELMIHSDKTQMNRLFTNLFQNAVEACQGMKHCIIEIEARKENGKIIIRISDNGEGISPEMQSRIFTPNFTTKSSGTGLGLAMCKGIVEQCKGKIWFETRVGEGTSFFIELPGARSQKLFSPIRSF